jgi:hypothetical protein
MARSRVKAASAAVVVAAEMMAPVFVLRAEFSGVSLAAPVPATSPPSSFPDVLAGFVVDPGLAVD